MATYYVRPDGSDSNSGTGPSASQAWATVQKAASTAAAGDTVWIAGGTYRENGVTVANSGTAEAPIVFAGDPGQGHFSDLDPAPVRITGCDSAEYGARSGDLLTSGKDYVSWQDIVLDGHTTGALEGANFVGVGSGRNLLRSVILSCSRGVRRASYMADCFIIAGRHAAYECAQVERCVAIGAEIGYEICPEVRNSIAIGGSHGFHGTVGSGGEQKARNCLAIGSGYGFADVLSYSCIALGAYRGYYLGQAESCVAHSCYIGYNGTMEANNCLYVNTRTATSGTITQRSGANPPAAGRWIGWASWLRMVRELAILLEPDLCFEPAAGVAGVAQDILLRPRPLGAGGETTTPGPWEYSDVVRENEEAIRIRRAGVSDWCVGAVGGTELTVSCSCTFSVGSGQPKPQLIVFGPDIGPEIATAVGDGSAEELSVSVDVPVDTLVTVRAYARDTSEGSYAIFADWEVSATSA